MRVGLGPWFTASFRVRSGCSQCGTELDEGDEIRADGEGGYLGECCGEDEDDEWEGLAL